MRGASAACCPFVAFGALATGREHHVLQAAAGHEWLPTKRLERLRNSRSKLLAGSKHIMSNRPVQCRAAVVAAGYPASGSEWQLDYVAAALNVLNVPFLYMGHWDAPINTWWAFTDSDRAEDYYFNEIQLWGTSTAETVFLYFSHSFAPDLLRLCSTSIVFITRRCLHDSLLSHVVRFQIDINAALFQELVTLWLAHIVRWRIAGAMDIEFSWMLRWPTAVIRLVAHHLALKLGLRSAEAVLGHGHARAKSFFWEKGILSNKYGKRKSHADTYSVVAGREDFREAVRASQHHFSLGTTVITPTLLGFRWCSNNSLQERKSGTMWNQMPGSSIKWRNWNASLAQTWKDEVLGAFAGISTGCVLGTGGIPGF